MSAEEMKEGLEVIITDPLHPGYQGVFFLLWKYAGCNLWALGASPNDKRRVAISTAYCGPSQCEPV